MKKRKITTAAFLAGVTTLAVSLPAMAQQNRPFDMHEKSATSQMTDIDFINGEDFDWTDDQSGV